MWKAMRCVMLTAALLLSGSVVAEQPRPEAQPQADRAADAQVQAQAESELGALAGYDLRIEFRYEGLMFCDVQMDGSSKVWNFLIDSGAGASVLNDRTANELGIEGMDMPGGVKGVGEQEGKLAQNIGMSVGGHDWTAPAVAILDLSGIADQTGKWMDGILGADWLMQFDQCKFDFLNNVAWFKVGNGGRASLTEMMQKVLGGGGGLPLPRGDGEGEGGLEDMLDDLMNPPGGDDEGEEGQGEGEDQSEDQGERQPGDLRDLQRALRRGLRGGRTRGAESPERKDAEDREGQYGPAENFSAEPQDVPFVGLQALGFDRALTRTIQRVEAMKRSPFVQSPTPEEAEELLHPGIPQAALNAPRTRTILPFRMLETNETVKALGKALGGKEPVLDPHWFVDITIDGKDDEIIFDTGAMGLFALDLAFSDGAELGRSFTVPVTGVGKNTAYMGIVKEFAVGGHEESGEFAAACLDLSTLDFEKALKGQPMAQMFTPEKLPKPIGLLGIEFARRYRYMTVDHAKMQIVFDPYSQETLDQLDPDAPSEEAMIVEAIKSTWAGQGGNLGFSAESLPIEEWEKYGVEGGLRVLSVEAGSGAEAAGLSAGDVLVELIAEGEDGEVVTQPIRSMAGAASYAAMAGAGEHLDFNVRNQNGKISELSITLGTYSGEMTIPERYREEIAERKAEGAGDQAAPNDE